MLSNCTLPGGFVSYFDLKILDISIYVSRVTRDVYLRVRIWNEFISCRFSHTLYQARGTSLHSFAFGLYKSSGHESIDNV